MTNERELLETLVKRGLLTETRAAECKEMQQMMGGMGIKESLEEILLKKEYVSKSQLDEVRKGMEAKPELIPGYTDAGVLGHGRFGSVHKAATSSGRLMAIKIIKTKLLRTPDDAERLLAEANKGMSVRHPNVAEVTGCGKVKHDIYVLSERVEGMNLADTVLTTGPLGEKKALQMAAEISSALAALHAQKLLHRNLTPGNVIFTKEGRVKITDFGLTRSVEVSRELNERGVAYGAPGWMSPEQIVGLDDIDGRADLYGLGAVLYFALTGQPLFVGAGEKETIERQLNEIPPDPRSHVPTLSHGTNAIVMKLLDRDRNRRYETNAELMRDVEAILNPKAAMAQAKIEGEQKGKRMTAIAVVAGLAAFAFVGFLFFRKPAGTPETPKPVAKAPEEPPKETPAEPPAPAPEAPKPPDPAPTPVPATPPTPSPEEDVAGMALLRDADKAIEQNRWEEASKILTDLKALNTPYVRERAAEIDQKLEICRAKAAEAAKPAPPPPPPPIVEEPAKIAADFKRAQQLMDAGKWPEALAIIDQLSEKVKKEESSMQMLKALREKCDREAQATKIWDDIQAAMKDHKWGDIGGLANAFRSGFENSETYKARQAELEEVKLQASREQLATSAIQEVKDKFRSLQFDEAKQAFADLKDHHGETESYKAAEKELRALSDGMDLEKKKKKEEAAKEALEEADKLHAEKKWAEADEAYAALIEKFKDTETVENALKSIEEKREAMAKKVASDRESAARKEYSRIRGLLDKKNYDEGVPALQGFVEKYGDTDFHKSKKSEIEDLLDRSESAWNRIKKAIIDDFESEEPAWEAGGVRADQAKMESVEKGKMGKAAKIEIPSHDEAPRDGRWPRFQKRLADELSEDVIAFSFWAKSDKPCKVTFEVRQGEGDSEVCFAVDKAVGTDWTLVTASLSEMKFVWSARRRQNPPKLDPTRIVAVGVGMMNAGKGIQFQIDHVKIEEKPR